MKWADLVDENYCRSVIQQYDNDLKHLVQEIEDNVSRDVYIKSIDINNHPEILNAVINANNEFYKFELGGNVECYFAKYPEHSHYNTLHMDCKPGLDHRLQRKISFSLILNDDFEGGEFQIHNHNIETKKGRLLVFPSFLLHAVMPITQGTRYCIFGFFLGPDWR
jgi:PKHD-type hydroxylase